MKFTYMQGTAHDMPCVSFTEKHLLRIRVGVGFGKEAISSDRLRNVNWPAGALEYLPPQFEHIHATALASDWMSVELEEDEWTELNADRILSIGPVQCHQGFRLPEKSPFLTDVYRALASASNGDAAAMEELGSAVVLAFAGTLGKAPGSASSPALPLTTLRRLADVIETNLHIGVCVAEMASLAKMSKFHFIGAFRRHTGITPHQFILQRRLEKAKQMLRCSCAPITTIAMDCGFSSHSHFTYVFSERMGMTPTSYRQKFSMRRSFTCNLSAASFI